MDSNSSTSAVRFGKVSLIFIGLIIGLAASLYYAWVVEPVVYVAASPARFNERYLHEYLYLVSQSYAADGNLELAVERLSALDVSDIQETVGLELETYLRRGEPASKMRNMATLAEQLGVDSVAIGIFVPQLAETNTPTATLPPTPLRTSLATRTPIPTQTSTPAPTPTSIPKFRLLSQEIVCLENAPAPRIEVVVVDAFLEPEPVTEVIVQWNEGVDHFFTGFQPDRGGGYGDFNMDPDINYQIYLADGSPTVGDLRIESCLETQGGWPGGWRLTFQNTEIPETDPRESDN